MLDDLVKLIIKAHALYIYGAGVRARLLASHLATAYGVVAQAFIVSDVRGNISEYVASDGSRIPVIAFTQFKETLTKSERVFVVNTVSNGAALGIVGAVESALHERGAGRCIDFTDGMHEDCNLECLKGYMYALGADPDSEILSFKGMRMFNPGFVEGTSKELLFPALGDVILPGIYDDHSLEYQGAYENGDVHLTAGDTVIDVGANIGTFACYAAHKGCNVIAFDPNPDVTDLLHKQSMLYPASNGGAIKVVSKGLADHAGSATFYLTDDTQSASLVSLYGEARAITIDLVTLDAYVLDNGIKAIDFIKLCICGTEQAFLRGARESIRRFRPNISILVLDNANEDEWERLKRLISDADSDYRFTRGRSKLYAWVPKQQ